MSYRIPGEDRLREAIEEALRREPVVDSQRALGDNVRRVLHEDDRDFRASDERIRRVALEHELARVRVRTGTTREPVRETCPVCGAELDQEENLTLEGDRTVVGTSCPRCPYSTGARHEVPLRYEFVREDDHGTERKGPF